VKPRIAIGGIWHETNTFASGITAYQDFENYQFTRADEMIPRYLGTNTELGGVIGEASTGSFTAVPTLYAAAVPSATIERKAAQRLCDGLIDSIKRAAPLDAVILTLHGAAVAEGVDDFDALILERTRHAVGSDVPIVATFDYHANLSEQMVDYASMLIGYDTYPHVDMEQRGAEAATIAVNILESGSIPRPAFRRIPLLTVPLKQQTDVQPMRDVMQQLHKLEKEPDIVCGSVAMGFPYCDVPHLGASVLLRRP
jgi:microcystin degradation protein MlrC